MSYRLLYFASLAEATGVGEELHESNSTDPRVVYAQLRKRYGFPLAAASVRLAINGEFAGWDRMLEDGDEIAFLPPVSGG